MNDLHHPCEPWAEKLSLAAAGCLSADEEREVRQHIKTCSVCCECLRQLTQLCGALVEARSASHEAEVAVVERVTSAVASERSQRPLAGTRAQRIRPALLTRSLDTWRWIMRSPVSRVAAAVVFVLAIGGVALWFHGGGTTPALADFLESEGIDVLLCLGGDGTQRGAHALGEEVAKRGLAKSVVGIPKTIDNDIPYVWMSFGYATAAEVAQEVVRGAHVEARGAPNGIGLVKVMGRNAGFIAAGAALASQEANFVLVPEVPFPLEAEGGFLAGEHLGLVPLLGCQWGFRRGLPVVAGEAPEEPELPGRLVPSDVCAHLQGFVEHFNEGLSHSTGCPSCHGRNLYRCKRIYFRAGSICRG